MLYVEGASTTGNKIIAILSLGYSPNAMSKQIYPKSWIACVENPKKGVATTYKSGIPIAIHFNASRKNMLIQLSESMETQVTS